MLQRKYCADSGDHAWAFESRGIVLHRRDAALLVGRRVSSSFASAGRKPFGVMRVIGDLPPPDERPDHRR